MAKPSSPPFSLLLAAVRAGNLDQVVAALDNGAAVDEADIHGHPGLPLRTACFEGNLAIIDELIRRGADVNAAGSDGPGMPIRLAVRAGHRTVVDRLLAHGASVPSGVNIDFPATVRPAPVAPARPAPAAPKTKPDNCPVIEEVNLSACYGVDTNVLTMDLLHLTEEPADKAAEAKDSQDRRAGPTDSWWKIR